jgi:tetratricopeptide (TPR) repeat protein
MNRNKKAVISISAGAIGLIIMALLLKFIINNRYRSQIPEISDSLILSQPVREQISDALENARRNPSADNLGMLGMVYHSSANYEQAAQCYKLAAGRSRSDWIWNYYDGYLNMEMGESGAVIENFKRVTGKNPDIDLAWYYMGTEYKNLGETELAEESFGKITTKENKVPAAKVSTRSGHFPLSIYAMFELSRIYFETGRNGLAEKTLEEIIEADRSFGPAYRLLGNIYGTQGDVSLSKQYVVRANDLLVLSPPVDTLIDKLALLSRSELYLLKKIDEAQRNIYAGWTLKLVDHALKYIPDNKYLISKAIDIYLWVGSGEQAVAFTDKHISYFRDSFTEMRKMGMLFFLNGLYPPAIKYLNRASD